MKNLKRKGLSIAAALLVALTPFGGAGFAAADGTAAPGVYDDLFSKRDLRDTWEDEITVTLNGDSAAADGEGVEINGSTVTIKAEGTYLLTGSLKGMVIVDCEDSAKVQLVLENADIESAASAAVYVKEADKVFLTLAEGSVNRLANGGTFTAIDENDIDAAVFSKTDLTVNGTGSLTVESPAGHGIVSKDDLAIAGGKITVRAADKGLSGNDSVKIAGGEIDVTSGADGIHAENSDKADKGYVYIYDGKVNVTTSGGDGISASSWVQVDGGEVNVTCTGASEQKVADEAMMGFGGGRGGRFGQQSGTVQNAPADPGEPAPEGSGV